MPTTTSSSTTLIVSAGQTSSGLVVSSGQTLTVLSGGSAVDITVLGGGSEFVASGGTATGTTVSGGAATGGEIFVSSGGIASGTVLVGPAATPGAAWSPGQQIVMGRAVGTIVKGGGTDAVDSGGTAIGTIVSSGGSEWVGSGGTASGTTVGAFGQQNVQGGTAVSTTVNSGGQEYDGPQYNYSINASGVTVSSATGSGLTLGTKVNSGGVEYVSSGGAASATTVSSGGTLSVGPGGSASGTVVQSGGVVSLPIVISAGQTSSGIVVGSGQALYVLSGGSAVNTIVIAGGNEYVSSGGTTIGTLVSGGVTSGGMLTVWAGGVASGTTLVGPAGTGNASWYSGEQIILGRAVGTIVSSGGNNNVDSGGLAIGTVVSSGGNEWVGSGGTASGTTVGSFGQQYVQGGTAVGTTVNSGGSEYDGPQYYYSTNASGVTSSATGSGLTLDTKVNSGGVEYVSSGGVANATTVSSGGTLSLGAGGSASGTVVQSGGVVSLPIVISAGQTSSGIVVGAGQTLYVLSGGSAVNTIVTNGGNEYVSSGGTAIGTVVSGGVTTGGEIWVSAGGIASGTVLVGPAATGPTRYQGQQQVFGSAVGTIVRSGGGDIVDSGGTAVGTTVSSGGANNVDYGGTGIGTVVSSGGSEWVGSGGTASGTTIDAFGQQSLQGGTAVSTTVNSGGSESVGPQYNYYTNTSGVYVSSATGSGLTLGTKVNSGGVEYVSSGGIASATTVSSGGTLNIASGVASGTNVQSGGTVIVPLVVSSGHTSSGLVVANSQTLTVLSGGSAVQTTVAGGGTVYISSGGKAIGTVASGGANSNSQIFISAGGVASGTVLADPAAATSGYADVAQIDGGRAIGTVVSGGGDSYVESGGIASGTTVGSGGYEDVGSGGTASGAIVNSGGTETVYAGSAVSATVQNGGSLIVSGGIVIGDVVNGGGSESVGSGLNYSYTVSSSTSSIAAGTASGTTVNGGGFEYVSAGGTTVNTAVGSGGFELVSAGAVASGTGVHSGGALVVFSGGVADNAVASSGGLLILFPDAKASGTTGAVVSTGVLLYAPGTGVTYEGANASGIVVSSGATEFILPGGTATATTVANGGTIDLTSLAYSPGGTVSLNATTDVLTVTEDGQTYTQKLAGTYTGQPFVLSADDNGAGTDISNGYGQTVNVDPGATVPITGTLAPGQTIDFIAGGTPGTLTLGSPSATMSNPINGFAGGDLIEFANGATVTAASIINGTTLAVTYHFGTSAPGVYDFTNVTFSPSAPPSVRFFYDNVTNDYAVTSTTYLLWTGATNTSFGNPSNWNLGTVVPSVADNALFNNGVGGTITGSGTVEGLLFANSGTWSFGSGADVSSLAGLLIGLGNGGTNGLGAVSIGGGSTIVTPGGGIDVGTYAGNVASLTISSGGVLKQTAADSLLNYIMDVGWSGASGTLLAASASVLVTGSGSLLDLPFNGLGIGNNGASGSVTVSNGGSLLATTMDSNQNSALAIGRTGNGTLTVTGAGSQVTAVGEVYVAHSKTGTLMVANAGTFLAAADVTGLAGITIGSGNTVGVGGTGIATVTAGGDLISQGYVAVGVRGTTGQLTVNNGTVQVGTTLSVGTGGTIQNGTSYAGNGTLTIGAGGTVELTGGPQTASFGVILAGGNNSQVTASTAVVSVSGAGALLTTDDNGIGVGQYGTASLTVSQGGSVAAGTENSGSVAALGIGRQGSGTVTVTGARLTADGSVFVGRAGSGTLNIQNQGTVLVGVDATGSGGITIGGGGFSSGNTLFTGGSGTASVTGGGYLFSKQDVTVGRNGTSGSLSVAGGTVEAGTQFLIGASTTLAAGAYDVVGNTMTQAATAEVFSGVGTVTVGTGGLIRIDGTGVPGLGIGSAAGGADMLSVISGGSVFAGGGLSIFQGGTVSVAAGGGIDVGGKGTISSGAINIDAGYAVTGGGLLQETVVNNNGTVLASAGGSLEITGSVAGTGTLEIASGATLQLDGAVGAGQTIAFNGPGATLDLQQPASPANPLVGFGAGDRIDLAGGKLIVAPISGDTLTWREVAASYVFTSTVSLANDRVQQQPDAGVGTIATLYAEAAATVTPGPVTFANVHVGASAIQTLTVANTAAASPYTEALDASLSGASTGFTSAGTITGLAAGVSDAKTLTITESTAKAGALTGSVTVALASDGTGIDGLGTLALASQTINLSGKVYALAAPILSSGTVSLGAARVGGTWTAGSITLSDGTIASAYQESLIYGASGATVSSGTIASGGSATVAVGLSTTTAGTITGMESLALTSTGAGTSGLANTTLAAQTVALSGTVFAAAKAALGASSINFGIVHVGAAATQTVGVTNTATGALVDVLTTGTATNTGGVSSEVYNLGTGLASGASGTVQIGVNTAAAGTISGTAVLGFNSHDGNLTDIAINGGTVTVTGTIDNYATAQIVQSGGAGTLTHSGTAYTLNFGNVAQGASAVVADLGVENTAGGPADLLGGSFTVSGTTAFANSSLTAFSGLGAGAEETSQVVTLNTGTAGVFSETITLLGTGSNSSGYSGTLAPEVLTVTGTVYQGGQIYTLTPAPATITGTAKNDTFDVAASTLNSHDSLDGGAGVNTLALLGGGYFDLGAPSTLADIQVVTAQESAGGTTVYMRNALNVTVNVAPAGSGSLLIYGASDSSVYNLGAGSDTVVLGSAGESVNGGGGTALVQAAAALAGAAVVGQSSGTTTLEITSGGTVALNAADTNLTVKLDTKTNLTLGSLGFITAQGSSAGGDTITAGGANQTLQSIGGNETLVGSASYGDTFLGTAAGFASDVIKNFGSSDMIDFTDIASATLKPLSFTAATGMLTASDATHNASVTLTGTYTAASFTTAADGHGGTLIKWV